MVRAIFDRTNPVGVKRDLKRVQIHELDHQLSYKWAFVTPHTCSGGSPRFILLIDSDGDGRFNFAANGQINPPLFSGCINGVVTPSDGQPSPSTLPWRFEDATDENFRWDITGGVVPGFPAYPGANWDVLEQLISTAFPNHQVLQVRLLEDFNPLGGPGTLTTISSRCSTSPWAPKGRSTSTAVGVTMTMTTS